MNKIFALGEDKQIAAHVIHFAPIAVGSEIYRVIYEVYSDPSKRNFLLKEYEVWLSVSYVEDESRLSHEPTNDEILDFANNYLQKRYKQSKNNIPTESGAYLTNTTGEIRGNPRTFSFKMSDKTPLVKTTLMLPKETHKWLLSYADEKNIGLGETVRRIVGDFQLGTASEKKPDDNEESRSGGVPPMK